MTRLLLAIAIVIAAGSTSQCGAQNTEPTELKTKITQVLTVQAKAWNDGDLGQFMQGYWKSEKLSFSSGGKTIFGWQTTFDRYKKSYSPPKEMGKLKFSKLLVTPIETNSALVLGNWALTMEDGSAPKGNFSLVFKKIDDRWQIIHDHTSLLKDDEGPEDQPRQALKKEPKERDEAGD